MSVTIEGLTVDYGGGPVVKDLDLTVGEGESVVLLGPSGCGKTTTMRCVAGLEQPAAGRIEIGGRTVYDADAGTELPPHRRGVGMVFQSYAVWPHMTVRENVAFSFKMTKTGAGETRERVDEALALVGLDHLSERGASRLSGGQMQRVALARSLVMRPSVLLLDEPLSNLDARLRERLRMELREIQQELRLSCLYVTHDQEEAFSLADRVGVMQDGRIVQLGAPQEVYRGARSATIADFLGVSNIVPCTVLEEADGRARVRVDGTELELWGRLEVTDATGGTGELRACVRPEDLVLAAKDDGGGNTMRGTVKVATFQGTVDRWRVVTDAGPTLDVVRPRDDSARFAAGDTVWVSAAAEDVQLLPESVGE